jgi:hypothetical protein
MLFYDCQHEPVLEFSQGEKAPMVDFRLALGYL